MFLSFMVVSLMFFALFVIMLFIDLLLCIVMLMFEVLLMFLLLYVFKKNSKINMNKASSDNIVQQQ